MARQRMLAALFALLLCAWMPRSNAAEFFGLIGNPNVDITGFGLFGNLTLTRTLEILEPQQGELENFDSIYVEDALWILSGELKRRGYLHPSIRVSLLKEDNVIWHGTWTEGDIEPELTPELKGDQVFFEIQAGVLFYFAKIDMQGLPDEVKQSPQEFFYSTDRLIVSEEARFYSAGRLANGLDTIALTLRDLGYRDAKADGEVTNENKTTGAVDVAVKVEPGPVYYVKSLTCVTPEEEATPDLETIQLENQRMTPGWLQDETRKLRNRYFATGHPDVRILREFEEASKNESRVEMHVILKAEPGPQVRIGEVRFENTGELKESILRRQTRLESGEVLNRREVEEGRDRLSKLGVFRTVRIQYDDEDDAEWDVVYEAVMKKQTIVDLILGVGSYDIIRGGFELIQNNLFGQAHQSRLSAIQSFKATYVDYTYLVPQIFGQDLDFFASLDYLRREEITFDREEYGGSAGFQRYFRSINTAASAQFNYGQVEARNAEFSVPPGPTQAIVSSITLKANRSELDNPVFPTRGWQVFGSSEFAFRALGGDVEFQRFELGGAWHHPITDAGLVFHAGYKMGLVTSFGAASENIPVPMRFFLGGENTVRGYRRDQASPINAQGQQIGAVSFMLGQVELEQRLTELFSVVAFVDTVGNAASLEDYPFNEVLMSVGAGISIRTVVGPLRFEYGHNVKKRPTDPNGTFQVALGFPF